MSVIKKILLMLMLTGNLFSQNLWKISVGTMVVAGAADVGSSIGQYERNPLVIRGDGKFDTTKGILLKSAITGGIVGVQWLLGRKDPKILRKCAWINFGAAGLWGGAAVHNLWIR